MAVCPSNGLEAEPRQSRRGNGGPLGSSGRLRRLYQGSFESGIPAPIIPLETMLALSLFIPASWPRSWLMFSDHAIHDEATAANGARMLNRHVVT
jgi:hypothetical protein